YTDQDKASSGSENEDVELSNSIGSSSKAFSKKRTSNNKQNKEDDYSTALTSAVVDFFNNVDQTIAMEEALTDQQIITL
ncbi:1678_t:CDS:2, partial [Dentiscutata heterogama]